jgi:hypothetical protein
MSRQAYRLERQLDPIKTGVERRLSSLRSAQAVFQLAAKQAEFGHLVADGYRQGRYSPIAALVRTLFEDATVLAWMAEPEGSDEQAQRATQVLIAFYRDARNKGHALPPDAEQLMKDTTGRASRKPPSMEDRVRQLDEYERASADGKAFWASHLDHVEMLNAYVHSRLDGDAYFTDPMTRELLGFEALVYGHQYLTLSVVSIVRLSDQNALAVRAQAAFGRIHDQELAELKRLIKPRRR